jgi:hypothetical protein
MTFIEAFDLRSYLLAQAKKKYMSGEMIHFAQEFHRETISSAGREES